MLVLDRRHELADFLRTRRARLTPAEVGLVSRGHRRTPGLRREEAAQLAGVGTTWYTWLEQGRPINPSPDVLDNIARALRLDADEQAHLFLLAYGIAVPPSNLPHQQILSAIQRVLDALDPTPAYLLGRYFDVVAWNRGANAVLDCFDDLSGRELNIVWRMFTHTNLRRMVLDWEVVAQRLLAHFRVRVGHLIEEPYVAALITDLLRVSAEFRRWWSQHDVKGRPDERKEMLHPQVGLLVFQGATLTIEDAPDLRLIVFTALDEQDTPAKLHRLVSAGRPSAAPMGPLVPSAQSGGDGVREVSRGLA